MQSQPLGVSANLAKRRKWLRLGVATLTSTALVGGSLVPVPAHPLIKNPLVAEAAAQELAESHAEGLAIELSLLRGFVAPEDLGIFDEALTAIHAEQSWPEDEGQPAQTSQLNLSLLQSVNLNLGSLSVPLIDDGSNNGLLQLNTDGVGVLSAYASAPDASTATASAGVINEDGSINADPSQGSGNVETNLQLTALLSQLGVNPLTDGIADDLSIRLGAVSSMAEANRNEITSEYAVANAELYLHSPLVEEIGGLVEPGGLGADLDQTVNGLLGTNGIVGGQILGLVNGLLGLLNAEVSITANTNLEATLDALLGQPLTSSDELVTIDLQSGEVIVNLEKLHGDNLSNLEPNTPLVNADQLNQIVGTVDGLLEGLSQQITDTLNDGVLQTELNILLDLGILLGETGISGTLSEIMAGTAETTNGGILGGVLTPLLEGLTSGIGTILGDVDEDGELQVTILDDIIGNLLTPVSGLLGAGAGQGLSGLINNVLGEVAQVTLNYQQNALIAEAGTVAGRPNARRGTLTDPTAEFSVQPVRVELLGLGTDGGVVDLPLARSTVMASDVAEVEVPSLLGIDPPQGPREGGNEVTLTGTNLADIDTIYVNETALTDFTVDPDTGSVTFIAPPWADLNATEDTVEVSVATGADRSEPLAYTYLDDAPIADAYDPGYEWVMIEPGETLPVPQSGDTTIPAGTVFEIDPNFNPPAGWTFTLTDPATGDLEVTAPEDAPPGMVFRVPVNATYPDGSIDPVSARMNVIMSPLGIEQIIYGDEFTTIIFTDRTVVEIPNGADGAPGADGAVPEVGENGNWWVDGEDTGVPATGPTGPAGESIQIVSSTTDPDSGITTIVFSDGNTVVIPAGQDGATGADGESVTVSGSELNADGDLVVTFSDGTEVVVPKGADGDQGVDGESLTITAQDTDADGNTVITFSDGTTVTVAKGDQGEAGAPGADGAVPEVGENGNWWVDGEDTGVSAEGPTGPAGESVTVEGSTTDADGNIVIEFSDGNTVVIPAGQDGATGADGESVTVSGSELNADGDLVVTFSDGTEVVVPKGADGDQGVDGESLTITAQDTDADGNTVITFSDGTTVTVAKGDQGEAGAPGADGKSAFELWIEAGNDGDINDFLESLKGTDGVDGEDGAVGQPGVDGKSAYELWLEAGNTGSEDDFFESLIGQTGADGKSAYDLWLEAGNTGSEQDFLDSLKGADGVDGQDGADGADGKSAFELWIGAGNDGDINDFLESLKGTDGVDGKSAYELWLEAGNTGSEDDFFESLIGQTGADGKSAYDLWLEAGNTGSEQDFLDSLKGADGVDGQDGRTSSDASVGSSGLNLSSGNSIEQCVTGNGGAVLALIAVLGAVGVAGAPVISDFAEDMGVQVSGAFEPFQPEWLKPINQGLSRIGMSIGDLAGPIAAVVGLVAALGAVNATCGPNGGSAVGSAGSS